MLVLSTLFADKVCYITSDPLSNKSGFCFLMFSSLLHKHLVLLLYSYMVIQLKMQTNLINSGLFKADVRSYVCLVKTVL